MTISTAARVQHVEQPRPRSKDYESRTEIGEWNSDLGRHTLVYPVNLSWGLHVDLRDMGLLYLGEYADFVYFDAEGNPTCVTPMSKAISDRFRAMRRHYGPAPARPVD